MSVDDTTSSSTTNAGCRILTFSASLGSVASFINRVKSLSNVAGTNNLSEVQTELLHPIVPFKISNRYYSADVHFAAYELKAISPELFSAANASDYKTPPAVIFVWTDGEPYAKHVEELSRMMALQDYEPEVCLAVRIQRPRAASLSVELESSTKEIAPIKGQSTEEDENEDIDGTLMSFGFEYVDATVEAAASGTSTRAENADEIPRLPRVLDALSTIMWPSMDSVSRSKSKNASKPNAKRDAERDSIMEELLAVSGISGISSADSRSRKESETVTQDESDDDEDALFASYDFNSNSGFHFASGAQQSRLWLNTSPTPQINVFGSTNTQGGSDMVLSPTDINGDAAEFPSPAPLGTLHLSADSESKSASGGKTKNQVSIGFEDDFTVFVSAPPSTTTEVPTWTPLSAQGASTDKNAESSRLAPSSAASLGGRKQLAYHSLGSVSDFGGDEEHEPVYQALGDDSEINAEEFDEEYGDREWEEAEEWGDIHDADEDDDEDEDMPTKEEIMATAAQIFGGALPGGAGGFQKASTLGKEYQKGPSTAIMDLEPEHKEKKEPADDEAVSEMLKRLRSLGTDDIHDGALHEDTNSYESDDDAILHGGSNVDIERVLHGLQAMRSEIANVRDEDERRRMAARVALGFVYGMDLDLPPRATTAGKADKK